MRLKSDMIKQYLYNHYVKHWRSLYKTFKFQPKFWSGTGLLIVGAIYGILWLMLLGGILLVVGLWTET